MRLPQDRFQVIKNYLHAAQACLLFLTIILTIAVYTRNGASDGRTGWYFALCWLTIPVLVYLVMVPMWSRTERFANLYAFATLDALFTVLWLSSWAAVASYVSAGGGCSNFSLGSTGKCKMSEGTIVLGVFMMVLFGGTSFLSFRNLMHYRRTGMMPSAQKPNQFEVQTDDAFSSNMQKDSDEQEDADHRRGSYPTYDTAPMEPQSTFDQMGRTAQYAPLSPHSDYAETQPQLAGLGVRYQNPTVVDHDTSYGGAYSDRRVS
jgi:translocation protein SEC72